MIADVRILGPLEVRDDTGRALALGSPKQRIVLALLALDPGRIVSADRIAFELWGDDVPRTAANTIQAYVSRLRSALGADVIATKAPGYALDVNPDVVDAYRFERLVQDARDELDDGRPAAAAERLSDALALWRGPALTDVSNVPACEREAERLEEARVQATEDRVDADLALGRHVEVSSELPRLIALHPLRERLYAQRMLALYRCGRQADALSVFAEIEQRLREELGVDPGAELKRLERAILRQDPELDRSPSVAAPASPPARAVPEPVTRFVGRSRELGDIRELLGASRLLTLTGPAGTGKTRLAVEALRDRDGVWFVPLAEIAEPDEIADRVASVLDVDGGTDAVRAIAERLGPHAGVLVLDNCEHVVEGGARLAHELLSACAALRILATSRETLRASGEVVYRVPPLPVPGRGDQDPLACASAELFVERARAVSSTFDARRSAPEIAEVVRRLDGIPLAIELAAARCDVLTPREIGERLDDALGLLTSGPITEEPHHRTLRAALAWSHDALDADEHAVFRVLGVFAGGFTLPHVEFVHGSAALDALSGLVARSLVETSDSEHHKRFTLLESVRQFSLEQLERSGSSEDVRRQHLACFEAFVDEHEPRLRTSEIGHAADAIDPEMPNIRAALSWAISDRGDADAALRIALSLQNYWNVRGNAREARRWLEAAIDAVGAHGPDVMQASLAAGIMCSNEGDFDAARRHHERALEVATKDGDEQWVARALGELAYVDQRTGQYERSEASIVRARELATKVGDDECLMRVLSRHADLAWWRGDRALSLSLREQAVDVARSADNPRTTAAYLLAMADIQREMGDVAGARESIDEGMDIARDIGYVPATVVGMTTLGRWAAEAGDHVEARRLYEEGAVHARETAHDTLLCDCLYGIALSLEQEGRPGDAYASFREAREVYVRVGDRIGAARTDLGIARYHAARGDERRTARFLVRALEVFDAIGEPSDLATALDQIGGYANTSGRPEVSARLHGAAARLRREAGAPAPAAPAHDVQPGTELVDVTRADAVREALGWLSAPQRLVPAPTARTS